MACQSHHRCVDTFTNSLIYISHILTHTTIWVSWYRYSHFLSPQNPVPPFACQFAPGKCGTFLALCTYSHGVNFEAIIRSNKISAKFCNPGCMEVTYSFVIVETHSHILAVADEEGSLRLLNVRKQATSSLVKGIYIN